MFPSYLLPTSVKQTPLRIVHVENVKKRGLDEEKILISRQLNILHTNLFKMIKPCLKENETRAMFLRILFKILADNKNEDTLS